MIAQELFDQVVAHLRKQNSKSLLTDEQCKALFLQPDSCAYRSLDGKKCAVGALITDEEYSPMMEGANVYYMIETTLSMRNRLREHRFLLRHLQKVHDVLPVERWEESLQSVAADFHLVYISPETHT